MQRKKKIFLISIHVIAWTIFFSLPFIFSTAPDNQSKILKQHTNTLFAINDTFLLAIYYLNTLVLIPKLLFQKKWLLYIASIVAIFIIFIYTPRPLAYAINNTSEEIIKQEFRNQFKQKILKEEEGKIQEIKPKKNNNTRAFQYFPGSFIVLLLIITIGICVTVIEQWQKTEKRKTLIENEKVNTELSFLKSQVNPHFFFNTLNNIYSLAVVQSTETPNAILKLSAIMRYILTDAEAEFLPLDKEIELIKNYLELQKVRLTEKVKVELSINGNTGNCKVPPLILMPFVENAFKYGVSTKEETKISINIRSENNLLTFFISNHIVNHAGILKDTTGIGINNVKRRLELIYANNYSLTINNHNNQIFEVTLQIKLRND